uniref:Uncharacterized protein n=1 Tax=Anguilla anguilla TaxID=7936 RepID=A0A0E9P8B3_ANGAN
MLQKHCFRLIKIGSYCWGVIAQLFYQNFMYGFCGSCQV